jgi:dihydroorotase
MEMRLPLSKVLARITADPAGIMGIDAGHLSVGSTADICIFDPEAYWKVTAAALHSQGKNTPFIGMELPGEIRYTLVHGQIVYQR